MVILQTKTPEGYTSLGAYVGIYYEAAVLIIFIILLVNLYRIYHLSKIKMTLNLLLGFTFYALGVFFSWLAKWYLWHNSEFALEGPYFLQLIYKFKISLANVIIGNYFIFNFYSSILSKEYSPIRKKIRIIRKIIEFIVVLTVHIPAYLQSSNELALISDSIAFLIVALDTLFVIPCGILCFKHSRNEAFGKKYINIGITAFFILNVFVMFFLDRLTMVMGITGPFGEPGYTIFYFLAWTSNIVGLIFAIYGFVKK